LRAVIMAETVVISKKISTTIAHYHNTVDMIQYLHNTVINYTVPSKHRNFQSIGKIS